MCLGIWRALAIAPSGLDGSEGRDELKHVKSSWIGEVSLVSGSHIEVYYRTEVRLNFATRLGRKCLNTTPRKEHEGRTRV